MKRSRVAIAVVLAAAIGLFAWRRRIPPRAPSTPWPLSEGVTLDGAGTTWRVLYAGDEILEALPEADAERAAALAARARRDDAIFLATDSPYRHYFYEEKRPVDADGASMRSWFGDYVLFEREKAESDYPVSVEPQAAASPAAIDLHDLDNARRELDQAARSAVEAIQRAHPATGKSKHVVRLLDGERKGLDARRDRSLMRVLATGERGVEIIHVPYRLGDPSLPPLGVRVAAEAVVGGKLVKDVVTDDQWIELLDGRAAVPPLAPSQKSLTLVDAHIHLADDDDDNLMAALTSGGVARAVVVPLPHGVDYGDLVAANERVLRAATRFPDRVVPLVMISPLADDPAADLEKLVLRGARGLKLMSGHDAYFKASRAQPLDDEKMRRVFDVCQRHELPVLWHVNSHLYAEGFLRILRDYPRVKFVNPHFGGYLTYAPAAVRQLLERYPNLYFDISLGVRAIYVRRSLEDVSYLASSWRQLFVDFPTRFLWGTDLVLSKEVTRSHTNATYHLLRDVYERDRYDLDYVPSRGFSWPWEDAHHREGLTGLTLPENVLRMLYAENADSIYGPPKRP